jgi:tetratricopeptide (TPR) repeat protein
MMADATTAMNTKNYEEAVRIMTEASQTAPTFYQVWGKLAECNMAYGRSLAATDRDKAKAQYQAAVTAYQKASELQPTDGSYNNNMADALGRLGKSQEALDQVKLALEKNPLDPKFHFNMGAILTNMGKSEDAVAAFDKAIAADPTYAEAYYQKGVNLMGRAKLDTKTGTMSAPPEVAESFNKYLELAPTGANAEGAKQLLASIGAKVETSFGKKSTPAKKR